MAYAADLKSADLTVLRVRVPSSVFKEIDISAGKYDIKANQSSKYELKIDYQTSGTTGVDLSSHSADMQIRRSFDSTNPMLTLGFTGADFSDGDLVSFSQGASLEMGESKFGNASLKTGGAFGVGSGLYPTGNHFLITGLDHVEYNGDDVYNISFFIKLNPNTVDATRRRIITTKDWTVGFYSFTNIGQPDSDLYLLWREDDGTVGSANRALVSRTASDALFDGDYLFMQFRGGGGKNVSMRLTANGFNYDANVSGDFPDFIGDDGEIYVGGRTTDDIPQKFFSDPGNGGSADDFSLNLSASFISDSAFRGNYDSFQIRNLGSSPANDGFIDPPTTHRLQVSF